jgi:threonine aldolase
MAKRLADGLKPFGEAAIVHPVEANEVFPRLPESVLVGLLADGFVFHRRPAPDRQVIRLVTSWATKPEEVDSFVSRALHHAALNA